jgi:endo-1,3(4)-beta-glucanase
MHEEIKLALPTLTENVYGFGKQAARLAQMAHIAHELMGSNISLSQNESSNMTKNENQDSYDLASLLDEAKFNLEGALDNFLNSRVSDSLVYDGNLGGMVTTDGLLNSEADFGNGRYNDHHFHYGYILYACGIMGKIDPSFVDKFGVKVDALYYDVAHGSNFDSKAAVDGIFFPGARHKVWFDGHSYASGMFSFGNGKSMESSSESVNCYYGALLWSIVRNGKAQDPSADDSPETDFARLLLATEIRGAKTYCEFLLKFVYSTATAQITVT